MQHNTTKLSPMKHSKGNRGKFREIHKKDYNGYYHLNGKEFRTSKDKEVLNDLLNDSATELTELTEQ